MPTPLELDIAPILAKFTDVVADRDEAKALIAASVADIAEARAKVEEDQAALDGLKSSLFSVGENMLSGMAHNLRISAEALGYKLHDRDLAEWYLQGADSDYLGLEAELKEKIIEVSGSDALFATYAPARPADFSPRHISGARQLKINAQMMERIAYMSERRFAIGIPKPV